MGSHLRPKAGRPTTIRSKPPRPPVDMSPHPRRHFFGSRGPSPSPSAAGLRIIRPFRPTAGWPPHGELLDQHGETREDEDAPHVATVQQSGSPTGSPGVLFLDTECSFSAEAVEALPCRFSPVRPKPGSPSPSWPPVPGLEASAIVIGAQ